MCVWKFPMHAWLNDWTARAFVIDAARRPCVWLRECIERKVNNLRHAAWMIFVFIICLSAAFAEMESFACLVLLWKSDERDSFAVPIHANNKSSHRSDSASVSNSQPLTYSVNGLRVYMEGAKYSSERRVLILSLNLLCWYWFRSIS